MCLCVKLHSRALGVQLGGLITFSRMKISEPPALKIFSHGPRLTSESLGLIACSRKKKCKFYETSFLTRFWYYFANILSHRQNFSKPYTLFLSLGVWTITYGTHMRSFSSKPVLSLEFCTTRKT